MLASEAAARFSDPRSVAKHDQSYKSPDVVAQRRALMSVLSLSEGDRVLDVGCGTGYLLCELSQAVGSSGKAVGVEPSAPMRDFAVEKLKEVGLNNFDVIDGNAYAMPVPDGSVDVVVFSQVLLYVPDVPRALSEAMRVLRRGGRLVVLDTDWGGLVVHTMHRDRFQRLQAAFETYFHDAHLPPKLPGLLAECGFELGEVTTIPMLASGAVDPEGSSFMVDWAFGKVPGKARATGMVPEEDIEAWLTEQKSLSESSAFFACVHRFVFVAQRP